MKMIPGRFSVIVPVFNSQRHLSASLDSVMAAVGNYGNAELIALDNGSTDDSYQILQRDYSRAQIHSVPSGTIAALRNRGAEVASGEYLSFIDSDCVIPPNYFHEALQVFQSVDAAATGSIYALPDTANWIEKSWYALHVRRKDGYVNYLNSGNLVVKSTAFAQVGGFDASLITCEDAELADRLRLAGFKIYESQSVRAIHLGIPRSLGQFVRRQAWFGQGMFGDLRLWKPLTTILLYLICVVLGLLNFYFTPGPLILRCAVFVLLVNMIPLLAVGYRLRRLGHIISPLPSLFLYHCFYVGRLWGLARLLTGRLARHYRKE
jgi:glycosyltransferase involved in cell wall biosynthesis